MDELLKFVGPDSIIPSGINIGLFQIFLALTFAFFLTVAICETYKNTHFSPTYSQSFLLTLIVMSMATCVIMIIIGSNIARAFSLVGALSIIRFRSAVKDSRDTAFVFLAITVGMACGTGFHFLAAIFTIIICLIILFLYKINYGQMTPPFKVVKVLMNQKVFESVKSYLASQSKFFSSLDIMQTDEGIDAVFALQTKKSMSESDLIKNINALEGVKSVGIVYSDQKITF